MKPSTSTVQLSQTCHQFEFSEILLATERFSESLVIGRGGFGKVYKGNVITGTTHRVVAIKRLDLMSNQGAIEFWAEIEMLSKLRHAHLVSLIGYCNHEKEMILVYEYMPRGTLEDHLHKLHSLSWVQLLKICIGAARGLDYLHTGTGLEFGVIHRDVKSSNILLHESWEAKISDFGLARIGPTNQPSTYVNTLVKGTFGYIDPNYFATGKLTRKSDVYAFGVVLFEVLCQKRPLDTSFECGMVTWIQESIKEGKLKQIVYSGIRDEISIKCLKGFVRIAERCLDNNPKYRPTMTEVVFSLETLLAKCVFPLQQKTNNRLQTPGKTILGRVFDLFPFSSPGEESNAPGEDKSNGEKSYYPCEDSSRIRLDLNMEDDDPDRKKWENLDNCILVKIFQTFNIFELTSSIAQVCRSWRYAACDPLFWSTLDLSMLKSNFIKIPIEPYVYVDGQSDKTLTRVLKISLNLSHGNISSLIFHFNLYVSHDQLTYTAERCPRLKRLVLPAWNRLKKTGICKAISMWQDLESLTMPSIANPHYIMEEISKNCKNFSKLKIMGPCDMLLANTLAKCLPNLKVLSLRCSMLYKDALITILDRLKHLEVLNISHCIIVEVPPPPASRIVHNELDNSILKKASRIKDFLKCMDNGCIMCKRTRLDQGLLRWYKYEEGLWKEDEVKSLAI